MTAPFPYVRENSSWKCVRDPVAGRIRSRGEEPAGAPRFQLYDLSVDIGEKKNVIEEYPEIEKELREILKGHIFRGRSTPGPEQHNDGEPVWETIRWVEEL